jgi:hypothetical protein
MGLPLLSAVIVMAQAENMRRPTIDLDGASSGAHINYRTTEKNRRADHVFALALRRCDN